MPYLRPDHGWNQTDAGPYKYNHLDPKVEGWGEMPVGGLITIGSDEHLTLTYTQVISATDVTYVAEVSSNMATWNSGSKQTALKSTTVNPEGVTRTVAIRTLAHVGPTGGNFVQLRLTRPYSGGFKYRNRGLPHAQSAIVFR
jgi:hypothetical protein